MILSNHSLMNLKIRRARHEDAKGIIEAHRRSIRENCSRDYNAAQIAAWSGRDFKEERWHQSMDNEMVWVIADEEENIYGFGHLQVNPNSPANLGGLYFVPEAIGLGLGKELVALMKIECRRLGVQEVHLTATKTSKKFYEKMDFVQVGDIAQIKMGDQILDCFKMQALLW
jgi:L-amino acid N-acyltransferase YncA